MAEEQRGFLVGQSLREKLKSTIAKVDGIAPGGPVTRIPTALEMPQLVAPKAFRICEFTGTWAIGTSKAVRFKYQTTTPNTVTVVNLVCGLAPQGSCDVSIAKEGTAWYLVQPNLTQQPGYSSSGTQVLTVTNGSLRWVETTACA